MATLKTYYASTLTDDGEIKYRTRMLGVPVEVSLVDGIYERAELVLPKYDGVSAHQPTILWEWIKNTSEDFVSALIENLGSGTVHVQWKGDKPTDSSDSTPLGTHITYNTVAVTRHAPLYIGSDAILVNSNAANHAGGPLTANGEENGKIYKIEVWNPDTSKEQTVRFTRFN